MRNLARLLTFALVLGLLAAAPVAASTSSAGAAAVADVTTGATLSTAKVVIIVGATGSATSSYRSTGDSAYAEAIKWSSNVIKVYSPNATWAAAKAALQGASVVVYLGHGNGWPSPYTYDPKFTTKDGFGLNATAGNGDSNVKYYGEPSLASEIHLAPNAVVLLNHLCYASGNSEPGNAAPTLSVAMQRADNYAQGFLKAGARSIIAEGHGTINDMIRDLFNSHQTVLEMWRNQSNYHGNEFSFPSMRSPAYMDFMDPDTSSGGYYRSLVGNPDLRTEDVTGVPYLRTDSTPDSLGPQLWSADGPRTVSPNGDGISDVLDLDLRFSESVSWTAEFRDASWSKLWETSGTGETPTVAWNLNVGSSTIPDGVYTLRIQASDAWGNPQLTSDLAIIVDTVPPTRLAGVDRYATGAAISAATYPPGVAVAYVATGLNFPDALAGAAAAGSQGAPILLVTPNSIPGATAIELTRLQPGRIVVLGASGVISNYVLSALAAYTTGTVTRIAGADRYATAAAISATTYAPGVAVTYVATGLNFPDALAGAAAAGSQGAPVLLVGTDEIPSATATELNRLQPGRIVILGAGGVVSANVANALQAFTTGTVTRLSGDNRYATAAAISAATYAPGVAIAYVATGANFPDALAGAAAAGWQGAPILLVTKDSIPAATAAELQRLNPGRVVILGSTGVVSEAVRIQLQQYVN